jgi:hypothetical protein
VLKLNVVEEGRVRERIEGTGGIGTDIIVDNRQKRPDVLPQ